MPLFIALMAALGWSAWTTGSVALRWLDYAAFGYLWMSIVTIMHDATHDALFTSKGLNLAFGIVMMIPIFARSEEHTSELQSLMRISYAVFCLKKKEKKTNRQTTKPNSC